ncbi:MAG: hypothetical protein ABSC47_02520 [Terracidiphilus sp.]|jgi:hypothetical protein
MTDPRAGRLFIRMKTYFSEVAADPGKFKVGFFKSCCVLLAAARPETRYNLPMRLAIFAMRLLEWMFFLGLAGSAVVVLISFVEDAKELFGKDEPPQPRA